MKVVIKCEDGTKSSVNAEKIEVDGTALSEWFGRFRQLKADFEAYKKTNDGAIANVKKALETNAEAIDKVKLAVTKTAGGN